ncbi:Membrane associated serine protease, rhomboid family [Phyllobacterium sp. YR620]|uniref:rhomboid family intramembrane serine protease n=1 Tax=Phyllobacterium sp. YR620 TaxID=1881066 RepID=UPI00088F37EB|nr:rhomboid family intramembrane serine protease [Phyllobacterium sp. YR620]SDP61645.1 Membrane associated serine protease, rhomboid family [Phyllobacterium sp. YR620]
MSERGDIRNNTTGREPVFNIPGIILAIMGLCALVYIAEAYVLDEQQADTLLLNFAFIPARFSQYGGFYSPSAWLTMVTYSFMHGSFAHIALNMIWLAAFGSPLAARIGPLRTTLFWIATAVAAVLTHFAVYPDSMTPLVGASGAVSGMMGAAARFGFRRSDSRNSAAFVGDILPISVALRMRSVIVFLGVWFVTNIVTGLLSVGVDNSATIAWEAHIGGFLVGFFGISLFDKPDRGRTDVDLLV